MKEKGKARLLFCTMIAVMLLSACGAKNAVSMAASSTPAASTPSATAAESSDDSAMFDMEMAQNTAAGGGQSNSVYQNADAKLIREANLSVQTTEFDQAAASLERLVSQAGGYFQSAAVYGGSYRDVNANRSGEYTIRIPAEQYEAFLTQTGNLGYVTYKNETTQNIGEQYYDTEARLKTQKTKQERLLSLLEKAETMEDIISLESALSDVEYEIEQLSSILNRYDSLVGFSTIYLTLDEVHKVSQETGVTDSLGARMAAGFAASAAGLAEGCQGLLVWISYHVFGLLIFAAVAAMAAVVCVHFLRVKKREDSPKGPDENKR